jgi:hypothetical protein
MFCPYLQLFFLGEKGWGFKVPLPQGEGFRVRAVQIEYVIVFT